MLSTGARRLYERLLDLGSVDWEDAPVHGPTDSRVVELRELGLLNTLETHISATPPRQAVMRAVDVSANRCREMLSDLLAVNELVRSSTAKSVEANRPSALVEVLTTKSDVFLTSSAVARDAQHSVFEVNTAERHRKLRSIGLEQTGKLQLLDYRAIEADALAADPHFDALMRRLVESGEEIRTHPGPPLKFKIADANTVLVPLDKTGAGGALLIRAPALCALFVDYFEKLWAESTPFDTSRTNVSTLLNPLQTRILGLIADDTPDVSIARKLDVSERTVRRHVGFIMDKLGARTRAGAVVMALERGLLAR